MENSQRPVLLFLGIYIFSFQWILTHQQVNLALGGIATQSSTLSGSDAKYAIDGNRESYMNLYPCTHTKLDMSPWWQVDLLAEHDIGTICITNRGDCCPERLDGAEIYIGNSLVNNGNNNPRCVVISSIPAGATATFTCNMSGRYVNIILPNISQYLTLCEVEVYGVSVHVTKTFLRFKFNSSENLTDASTRDKVLQKMNAHSGTFKIKWTKKPELETET